MQTTYLAMQVSTSGLVEMVNRPVLMPDTFEVLIQVEACEVPYGVNLITVTNYSWIANE